MVSPYSKIGSHENDFPTSYWLVFKSVEELVTTCEKDFFSNNPLEISINHEINSTTGLILTLQEHTKLRRYMATQANRGLPLLIVVNVRIFDDC